MPERNDNLVDIAKAIGFEVAVNELLEQAIWAGARLMKSAQKVFWGSYSGYCTDPDGYRWKVAHNPLFRVGPQDDDGPPRHAGGPRATPG